MSTTTATIEHKLSPWTPPKPPNIHSKATPATHIPSIDSERQSYYHYPPPPIDAVGNTPSAVPEPPSRLSIFEPAHEATVVRAKQKWNEPAINKWRMMAAFLSFVIVGANDAAYGALVPYVRDDYAISTTAVSAVFVTPFVGYALATVFVNKMHMSFGQRGIAIVGPLCHLVVFVVMACHPPFPVVVSVYTLIGLGNGLIDTAWNAWVGDMVNANALMGFLHAFYGVGATISPAVATSMIEAGRGWWQFYYTLIGAAALELVSSGILFWPEDAARFRENNPKTPGDGRKSRFVSSLKSKAVWILSAFLFVYMGVEVSIGGWIVEFMMQVRNAGTIQSGLVPTGFWLGITVGRLALGFVTERLGERVAVLVYLVLAVVMQLVFWLVPSFIASAVAVSFIGFFTGPLFPAAMVVAAKLLPKHLHTAGIGIASSFAGGGAALLPFVAGALAGAEGVRTLQPYVLSLLVVITVLWLLLPRTPKTDVEA